MLKKSLQPVCIVSALNSSCFIKITGGKMNFFKSGSDILPTDITDRAHTEKYRNEGGQSSGISCHGKYLRGYNGFCLCNARNEHARSHFRS